MKRTPRLSLQTVEPWSRENEFNHLCCDGYQTLQDNLKEKILYNRTIILNALQNPQHMTWSGTKVLPCFSQFTTHITENLSVHRAVQARWIKNLTVGADTCRSNGRKYARKWKTLKCCRKSATSCDRAKGSVKYWQSTVLKYGLRARFPLSLNFLFKYCTFCFLKHGHFSQKSYFSSISSHVCINNLIIAQMQQN